MPVNPLALGFVFDSAYMHKWKCEYINILSYLSYENLLYL